MMLDVYKRQVYGPCRSEKSDAVLVPGTKEVEREIRDCAFHSGCGKMGKNMKGAGMMKSYRKELWFHVPARRGLVNITPQVEEALRESGIKEGLVLVNAMNITASAVSYTHLDVYKRQG